MIYVDYPFLTQDQISSCVDGTLQDMKGGCNTFSSPNISAGFMADWYDPKWTANITLNEVTSGEVSP